MLVHGGRHEWVRLGSLASIMSALLVLGAGCGSRTSLLDVDSYGSEGLGGDTSGVPVPDPRPGPNPQPGPNPRPGKPGLVRGCESAVSSGPENCIRYHGCMDGSYLVECVRQLDGKFSCACSLPSGMMQGAIYGAVSDPCLTAGTDCGFY